MEGAGYGRWTAAGIGGNHHGLEEDKGGIEQVQEEGHAMVLKIAKMDDFKR